MVTLPLSCSRLVWLRAEQVYHADDITEASLVHANEAGSLADDLPLQFGRHGGLQGGEHTAMLSVTGAATTVHMGHSEAARAGILPLVITYVLEWIPKKAAPRPLQPSSAARMVSLEWGLLMHHFHPKPLLLIFTPDRSDDVRPSSKSAATYAQTVR